MKTDLIDSGKKIRRLMLMITTLLIGIGVVMVYSSSAVYSHQVRHDSMFYLKRHLVYVLCGLAAGILAMRIPVLKMKKWVWPLMGSACFIIVATSLFSDPSSGARRWIHLGPVTVQPSEFSKIIFALCAAVQLSAPNIRLEQFKRDLIPLSIPTGCLCLSILIGKDLGTVVVIATVYIMMLFIKGMPLRKFFIIIGSMIPVLILAIIIEPYRVRRIVSFLNPLADTRNAGFQLYQSLLAVGSGGLTGTGIGQSQQKLFYLPAQYTDFIFAIIAEETGFIGSVIVILLFAGFGLVSLMIILRCRQTFLKLFAFGLSSLILVEMSVNIGVSLGMLPTKGLALPFISYGGSSLISKMLITGLLLNISKTSDSTPSDTNDPGN